MLVVIIHTQSYNDGIPGCIPVGLVDCVHIGWNRCPVYHENIFKGSKGYPSAVFEVVSDHRRRFFNQQEQETTSTSQFPIYMIEILFLAGKSGMC
jgi:hypothetical protein